MRIRRRIALIFLSVILLMGAGCDSEEQNPKNFCPLSGSKGQVILLIDTTDPLTPAARERLEQLLEAFRDPDNEHYLPPGHQLIVYHVSPQKPGSAIKPAMSVCNPGNPEDRTFWDDMVSSPYDSEDKWFLFKRKIINELPPLGNRASKENSPLLETIAVVSRRYVSTIGSKQQSQPARIILFSDMMQHSDYLSHYNEPLPAMGKLKNRTGYSTIESDFKGIDVWLYYVRRSGFESMQTEKHQAWWRQLVKFFDGRPVVVLL